MAGLSFVAKGKAEECGCQGLEGFDTPTWRAELRRRHRVQEYPPVDVGFRTPARWEQPE